jgi:hypothetical protein
VNWCALLNNTQLGLKTLHHLLLLHLWLHLLCP